MKRGDFLSEITKSILLPYEASEIYEEEIVGEFENQFEAEYFNRFLTLIGKEGLVLDLACGDGRHTLRLSERANHVVALDLSPNNLKMAKRKCQARKNITFIEGSMFELPFSENTFDGIWFSQAFEYVPPDRREAFLASLKHVLKPGGILYMSVETWMHPSLWDSLKEFLGDFRLFCYWKFLKRKPLLWGEFLYYLRAEDIRARYSGWHYHVHTDKWTLLRLLKRLKFEMSQLDLYDGRIYTLCRKELLSMRQPIQVLIYPVRLAEGEWEYLLLRRIPSRGGFWQGVTGGIEEGEDLVDGARRELTEETRLAPIALEKIDYSYSFPAEDGEKIIEYVFVAYVGDQQEPIIDLNEHDQYKWCRFNEALRLLTWPENKEALKRCNDVVMTKSAHSKAQREKSNG